MGGKREAMVGMRIRAVRRGARAHYSLAVALRGAPVEKRFTLQDCLSQSLAHRRDPEGTAEEIILPRAVEADGIKERRPILRVCELAGIRQCEYVNPRHRPEGAGSLFDAILCA